ncbi:MAG: NAD-dependent epimerase/dehydratase family protein [Betaproteobacteria bacterium]|nr:MAG: NAD-dependent epimerase/dehydratase family protein [Betaproteobacteria bacterium]
MLQRLVVVGATGYLGGRIMAEARAIVPSVGTSSRDPGMLRLDLDRPEEFDYAQLGTGDVVMLCGGITDPDACAREHARAWALNVEGTIAFMERALRRGARVVFFSSDTVYGERDADFDEAAACRPAGAYATMKGAVERHFAGHAQVRTLRLSYVFSGADKFTRYLQDCLDRGEEAAVFQPFERAIVHRDDVVAAALGLAQRWQEVPGYAINIGGPEIVSRIEFAEMLKNAVMPRLRYRKVDPGPEFFHNRPRVIRMRSPLLASLLRRPARALREAIRLEFRPG